MIGLNTFLKQGELHFREQKPETFFNGSRT